jgi:hypothetical protein
VQKAKAEALAAADKYIKVFDAWKKDAAQLDPAFAKVEAMALFGKGPKGDPGLSAYQVAVKNGFVGTEAQWLASLKGPKGDVGPMGPPGKDAPPAPPVVDPLTQVLTFAYGNTPDAEKVLVAKLATLYDQASKKYAQDPAVTTTKGLLTSLHSLADGSVGMGLLANIRKALETYLDTKLPITNVPLTQATRDTASAEFAKISAALNTLGAK